MCDIALTLSSSEWWLIITPCGRTSAQRVAQTIAVALGTRTFGFPVEPEVY